MCFALAINYILPNISLLKILSKKEVSNPARGQRTDRAAAVRWYILQRPGCLLRIYNETAPAWPPLTCSSPTTDLHKPSPKGADKNGGGEGKFFRQERDKEKEASLRPRFLPCLVRTRALSGLFPALDSLSLLRPNGGCLACSPRDSPMIRVLGLKLLFVRSCGLPVSMSHLVDKKCSSCCK